MCYNAGYIKAILKYQTIFILVFVRFPLALKNKKEEKPKHTQKTLGIDGKLWNELDAWLKTDEAKLKGFNSKARFANMAIGDYLTFHRDHVLTQMEMLKQVNESYKNLSARFDKQLEFVDKLEKFWFKMNFPDIEGKPDSKSSGE